MAVTSCSAATTHMKHRRWLLGWAYWRRDDASPGRSRGYAARRRRRKGLVNEVKRFTAGAATAPVTLGHYRWMHA